MIAVCGHWIFIGGLAFLWVESISGSYFWFCIPIRGLMLLITLHAVRKGIVTLMLL